MRASIRQIYVYAKTSRGTADVREAMQSCYDNRDADAAFVHPALLGFGPDRISWNNGYVLRTIGTVTPPEFVSQFKPVFETVPIWAVMQPTNGFLEFPSKGRIEEFKVIAANLPIIQYFLLSKEGDMKFLKYIEDMRGILRNPSYPVFDLSDGLILLVATNEPANTSVNRCRRALSRFKHWVAVDASGLSISDCPDTNAWPNVAIRDSEEG